MHLFLTIEGLVLVVTPSGLQAQGDINGSEHGEF